MPIFRSFKFDLTDVTAMVADESSTRFIWAAFELDATVGLLLKKLDAFDLDQLFSEVQIDADKIVELIDDVNFIYGAVEDDINIGFRVLKTTPVTTITNFTIPIGVNEFPIDIVLDGIDLFYLTPGNASGEFAKVIKMDNAGTLDQVITLDESTKPINNAKSITVDTNNNLWIVTANNPTELIRLFQDSFGDYQYEVTPLIV